MKRLLSSLITCTLICAFAAGLPGRAYAAPTTLSLNPSSASVGDPVTASGASDPDTWVAVKAVDGAGSIVFFDEVKSGPDGTYNCTFLVPPGVQGSPTVVAGYGSNVATASLTVWADLDAEAVAGAKALLVAASLDPEEGTDTNIITKAQSVVDAVYSGVTVTIDTSANPQIAPDGTITYGSSPVTGNVTFRLTKNF